ncbi:MAG: Lrp/AsnC family transcriptional regulator [Boseongicola sp. SB0664_bin_43]|uniref:Lrp/AsnC family transcriptional regulator n=1 Tax=Boseongicola sp. SB0664_bin_43 TaxID=2604844 RepID=A0A6B0Y056_9RHOB|nr:Lrp/AsnC family transcriptional regulator [Boseongicola sp. SB0664_bin_43]MYK32942.1 Lrp/AsnC family transcriptional regulator [Boseongicola sp. SB0670_bin_30]
MMDDIDKKILHALSSDARRSVESVAEEIGLSTTPTRRRIKNLEAGGIIRRYTVDVDMEQAGYGLTVYVFMKLQSRDQATIATFEDKIKHLPEVTACALVTGPHDYVLTMRFEDMEAYNRFLRSVLAELPGVLGIETSVVIGSVKDEVPLPH